MADADTTVDSEGRGDVLVKCGEILKCFLVTQLCNAHDNTYRQTEDRKLGLISVRKLC